MSSESNLSTKNTGSSLASEFVECGYVATVLPPCTSLIGDLLRALETAVADGSEGVDNACGH